MTHRFRRVACLLFVVLAGARMAAAQVGLPTADPAALHAGAPAQVTVTSLIADDRAIPTGVNVQRLDATGRAIAVLGTLRDDGIGSDLLAGDRVFSGNVPIPASAPGQVRIRVSAALRGVLVRAMSPVVTIDVLPQGIPTEPSPPDMAKAVTDAEGHQFISNEVLACFGESVGIPAIQSIAAEVSASIAGRFSGLGNCYQLRLPDESTPSTVDSVLSILSVRAEVTVAARHDVVRPTLVPVESDASFEHARFPQAHTLARGTSVLVAVLDTGVDAEDSRLFPLILGANTIDPDSDTPDDMDGHGTYVAGIVRGTAPESEIYVVKVMDAQGGTIGSVVNGILDAVSAGARVLNLSFDTDEPNPFLLLATTYARLRDRVIVAAAGNEGNDQFRYPAAFPGVIAVGNVDGNDDPWHTSSRGTWVDVSAPGVFVASTWLQGGMHVASGTSGAAPFVAGAAALILGQNPSLSAGSVASRIIDNSFAKEGWDRSMGAGRLDVLAALTGVHSIEVEPFDPIVRPTETIRLLASAKGVRRQTVPFFEQTRLEWTSDRPDIASVDPETGEVTAVAVGEAEITVTEMTTSDAVDRFCARYPACSGEKLEGEVSDPSTTPPTRRRLKITVAEDVVAGIYDAVSVGGVPLPRTWETIHHIFRGQMRFNDYPDDMRETTGDDGLAFGGFVGDRRFPPDPPHPFGWSETFGYWVSEVSDVPIAVFPGGSVSLPPGRIIFGNLGTQDFPLASLAADGRTLTMYVSSLQTLATLVKRDPVRVLRIDPTSRALSFPDTRQEAVSPDQTITLENTGPEPVTIQAVWITFGGVDSEDFVLSDASGACDTSIQVSGVVLEPGETCTLEIAFSPQLTYTTGPRTANLTFWTNAGSTSGHAFRQVTISLDGTATGEPALSFSPPSLSFPVTASGSVSQTQFVLVQNMGQVPLVLGVPSGSSSFPVDAAGCRNRPLPPGGSCSIAVSYGPFGQFAGTLTIPTNTGSTSGSEISNATVTLSAANEKPVADATADSVSVFTGTEVDLHAFQSRDLEGQPLTYAWQMMALPSGSAAALGDRSSAFAHFTPDRPGQYVIQLVVNDGFLDSDPDLIVISAMAPPGVVQLSQTALTFPTTPVGERSATQTITVTNTGGSTVTIASATFGGDFGASSNACATLAVQQTCAIDVYFAPTVTGPLSGHLTLVSDAANSPTHVVFSGAAASNPFIAPRVTGTGEITVTGNWTLRFFSGDDDEEIGVQIGSNPWFGWEEDETPGRVVRVEFGASAGTVRFAEEEDGGGLRPLNIEPLSDGRYLVHLRDDDPPNEIELTLVLERTP